MQTFLGDKKLKTDLLKEIKKHEKADEIAQGSYESKDGKGKLQLCAVGCALYSLNIVRGKKLRTSDHSAFEPELGIPRVLARLTDRIFEGLELDEAKKFPREFIESIAVGADLSLVWPKFIRWLLIDANEGVIRFAKTDRTRGAIQAVGNLYTKKINGEAVETKEWEEARSNAYDADDAAYAAAAYAAAAYAAAAAAADADAADAAAYAYAAYAYAAYADAYDADAYARKRAWKMQKEKLLELIRECK